MSYLFILGLTVLWTIQIQVSCLFIVIDQCTGTETLYFCKGGIIYNTFKTCTVLC